MEEMQVFDPKPVRKVFSRVGWSFCALTATLVLVQVALILCIKQFWPDGCWLTRSSTGKWLVTFVPLYIIAIPVGVLCMRKIPAYAPQQANMSLKNFFIFLPICFFLIYSGNLVGNGLSSLFSGGNAENALDTFAQDSNPIKFLFRVILAPLFEEYVTRKQVIDRTRIYGEKTAVMLSAVLFALMHMNLFQFFYAFLLGWVFGYIYLRTGRLRYCVILHSIVNFVGSIVAPFIMSKLDLEALSSVNEMTPLEEVMAIYQENAVGLMMYYGYLLLIGVLFIAGLILMIVQRKKLIWRAADAQLPYTHQVKAVYLSAGMLVFLIFTAIMTVLSIVA